MTAKIDIRPLSVDDTDDAFALYNMLTLGPPVTDKVMFANILDHSGTVVYGAFDHG